MRRLTVEVCVFRDKYLFKAQVPELPDNASFRRLYPKVIDELEVKNYINVNKYLMLQSKLSIKL